MASLPLPDGPTSTVAPAAAARRRAYWLRTLYRWHWLSSAACLVALVGFAFTGITLNHAGSIEGKPVVTSRDGRLPEPLAASLRAHRAGGRAPLPAALSDWLTGSFGIDVRGRDGEWSDREIYIALPRPGGDAWATVSLADGAVAYEKTDRGWIAFFNDLHKGRNTGSAWAWFIDVFAVACLLFAGTGLVLLWLHGRGRPATWPMVAFGVVLPLVLAILFIH